ncbi:hypothetical protein H8K32_12005 [Undibacterium jejuense]|uniref:YXWGXW repeat-containing protein n=1 Tax=Undibacterium jejuense TaxID=1344949 RepID=A0A923KQ85_9BURK|nr:YXWGXW repeat-containing protein [Undibacterium jejuense]MBC3862829.1 hypothetical protein [Undibacterium jejuense]
MKKLAMVSLIGLSGCVVQAPPRTVYVQQPPRVVYQPAPAAPTYYQDTAPQPQQEQVVSAYVEPPTVQPEPILVQWAPPPMLVEVPPPQPYITAVWTGGYWVWHGDWIWAHGRWAAPPQFGYCWMHPYYENRGGAVVFVNGFWAAPGVHFIQPSLQLHLNFAAVNDGVIAGVRPIGPQGVFIPAPPGSARGLIVPAPIGTSPAVVTSAPPIIREGMRVHIENNSHNATVINNNTTIVNNVTIVAPPGSTANGQAFNRAVPAQAHLAAQMTPVVKAMAPEPVSTKPIPSYSNAHGPVALPPSQMVHFNNQATPVPGQPQHMPTAPQQLAEPQQRAQSLQQHIQTAPQPVNMAQPQHQTMPASQERYLPQEHNFIAPVQRTTIETPNQARFQHMEEQSHPVAPTPHPESFPHYQEIRPIQHNPANDMRTREEMERRAVPVQHVEPRNAEREKDAKAREKEHER